MRRIVLIIGLFGLLVSEGLARRIRVPIVVVGQVEECDDFEKQLYEEIRQELVEYREIFLFSSITNEVADQIVKDIHYLNTISKEPITIYVNSPGGDLAAGSAILSAMRHSEAPIRVVVTGQACSMAAFIVLVADEAFMYPTSMLMIHPLQVEIGGPLPIVRRRVESIVRFENLFRQIVEVSGKFTEQEIEEMFTTERWFTPEEALEKGLITGIVNKSSPESVEVIFNEKRHLYYVNGEHFPAVSAILNQLHKPALIPWALKLVVGYLERHNITPSVTDYYKYYKRALAERDSASEKGTIVHTKIERFLAGKSLEYTDDEEINNALDAFLRWYEERDVETVAIEGIVFSFYHRYAGTFDVIARVDGKLTLIDLKTSKDIYPEYVMQIAAYRNAIRELGGYFRKVKGGYEFVKLEEPIEQVMVLRLDKKSGYPVFKIYTEEELVNAFSRFSLMARYYYLDHNDRR